MKDTWPWRSLSRD